MGLQLISLTLVLLTQLVRGSQDVGTYNLMLDPGRIYWWKTKWMANPIDVSKSNSGSTVSLTFNFNPSTSLTKGVFEVTLPGNTFTFPTTTGYEVVGNVVRKLDVTYLAGQDTSVTFSPVTLPTNSAGYGPFALRSRFVSGGQIIDSNVCFGTIFVNAVEGAMTNGVVSYVPNLSSSIVYRTGNTLSFRFNIAKDMWRFDMFKITVPAEFTVIMGNDYMCYSMGSSGYYNNFNGTRSLNPTYLDCVVSDKTFNSALVPQKQTLWIYGLNTDILEMTVKDNTFVDLRVPGVMNPNRTMGANDASWTVETVRFGTTYTLEAGTLKGPAVVSDTLTSVTWKPTWGMSTSLISSTTIYMDVTLIPANHIQKLGTIDILLETPGSGTSGIAPGSACVVLSDIGPGTTCTISSQTMTLGGFNEIKGGTTILVRYLAAFGLGVSTSASVTVTTKYSSTADIDKSTKVASFTTLASGVSATTLGIDFYGNNAVNNKAGGTGLTTYFLSLTTGAAIPLATISLYCPLSSAVDDFQIYIPSVTDVKTHTGTIGDTTTGTPAASSSISKSNGSLTASSLGVVATVPGLIKFTNSLASALGIAVFSSTSAMYSPRIIDSGAYTAYECRIEAVSGSSTFVAVKQISIGYQSVTTNSGYTYFCTKTNVDGIPVKASFQPSFIDLYTSTSTKTYYLEIDLQTTGGSNSVYPTLHNSNVKAGGAYPMDSNLSTGATMILANDKSSSVLSHRVTGLGSVTTTSSPVQIFFPVGSNAGGTINFSIFTFFTYAQENRTTKTRYYTHGYVDTIAVTSAEPGTNIPTITGGGSLVTGSSATSSTPLTMTVTTGAAITGDAYFFIILPAGFSFSALRDVQSSYPTTASSFSEKRFFSSPSSSFAFPGVLVKQSLTGTQLQSTATTLSVFGLVAPLGVLTANPTQAQIIHGPITGALAFPLSACAAQSGTGATTMGMSVTTGTITSLVVSPTSIQGRGPNGADISQTIQVTLPHGIDEGGSMTFTIDSNWGYISLSGCTVSGVNILDASIKMCTNSGSTFTIKNFQGFEKVTNQAITIYLTRLLPPDITTATTTFQFVTAFYTTTSTNIRSGVNIDTYAASTGAIVTVNVNIVSGQSTFKSIRFLPPNAGTIEADLYLMFTLPYDLPADTVLAISVPYTAVSTSTAVAGQNRCWMSPLTYSACTVGSTISITLAAKYQALASLEVFVRRGFTTPSEVPVNTATSTSTTVYGFKVTATWGELAKIIEDPAITTSTGSSSGTGTTATATSGIYASAYGTRLVVPSTKVTTLITAATPSITFQPRNAGELASYKISFKLTAAYSDGDSLQVIWPDEYDPYVGEATELLTQDPGNFYLTCTCPQLGSVVWCYIDHWVMLVKGTLSITAGSQVDITVEKVRNPFPGTTGNFRVFHYNTNSTLIQYSSNIGTVTTTNPPNFLEIRALNVTNRYLERSSDYTLNVYGIASIDTSTKLQLLFPKEYDLSIVEQKDSYTCATQWMDRTNSATSIKTPQEWNTGANCDQANNFVSLAAPTVTRTFTTLSYVTWNITNVLNPLWGYSRLRSTTTQDMDIQDWDVWTIYSYWTSKFRVFTYSTSSTTPQYLASSYYHATGAYLGFMQNKRTLIVNGYNPLDRSNRIIVWPGTQTSDLYITTSNVTWPMQAKQLTFTPSTNARTPDNSALKYTSKYSNFVMLQEEWQIRFRVAASIDAIKGLYYINWKLAETVQPGVDSSYYLEPTPTLVEIAPKVVGRYWFAISNVPTITVGSSSVPIKISTTNAPHSEVIVNIAVQTVESVVPEPKALTFRPDVNEMYFYLTANSTHDVSIFPSVVVVFTITGADAAAFAIQPAVVVGIQSKTLYSTGNIAKIGITNVQRTSVSIAPTTDQLGVLYWQVLPKGNTILTFQELKALIPTFIKTDSDFTADTDKNSQARGSFESDPQSGETWQDFQTRLYLTHVTTFVTYGAIAMVQTVTPTPTSVTGLWADTAYQVVAYFDNFNTNETSVATRVEYFDTLTTHDCQPVYVRFQFTVAETFSDTIFNILAKYLGVNPLRLIGKTRTTEKTSATRELQAPPTSSVTNSTSAVAFTVFSGTILPNRGIETPTPTGIATLSNEAVDRMQQDFVAANIQNRMWNYGPLAIPTRTQPLWSRVPQIQRFSNTTIIVQFLSTTAGKSCCEALLDTNANLKPEQVYHLYSYNWTRAIGLCIDSDTTQSINYIELTGLEPDTNYYVHCVSTDNYPLWPTQMTYTSTLPVPFIPIHTPIDLEIHYELSHATGLQFFLFGLLALLLH